MPLRRAISCAFMAFMAFIPKSDRGLRCTKPFCDFECLQKENCNMGDMGADIDIDVWTVRRHAYAYMQSNGMKICGKAQVLRWLQCHGLTLEGLRCITAACQGVFALHTRKRKTKDGKTEEHATLRCTSCHKETSARGEFFGHYKGSHLTEAMQLLYAVAERWRPQQVLQELSIRDRARFVSMMDHTGKICQYYLEALFKASLGKWESLSVDEAATGQAKKARSGKAKQATKKGLRWWLSLVKYREAPDGTRKCEGFFFEPVPKLEWTDSRTGKQMCKIRTKEHLTWHIERLAAKGATVITDSHKGYQICGTELLRPDITHLDCNHSLGFSAPGKKAIAAGVERVNSNITEGGGHATLYRLVRPWVGRKIGTGSDEHELMVKDTAVAMMNWMWQGKDALQEFFLWLRFLYGSLEPTSLEKNVCKELSLTPRPLPDYKAIEELFEGIDLEKETWDFIVGPELPEVRKAQTSKPAFFECAWRSHIAVREHDREVNWQETNTPPQWQFPLRLIDLTSPFLPQVAPKRPRGKQPRPPRRRGPAEIPAWALSLQLDPENPDFHPDFDIPDFALPKPKKRPKPAPDEDDGTSGVSFGGPLAGLACSSGQRQLQLDADLGWSGNKENRP